MDLRLDKLVRRRNKAIRTSRSLGGTNQPDGSPASFCRVWGVEEGSSPPDWIYVVVSKDIMDMLECTEGLSVSKRYTLSAWYMVQDTGIVGGGIGPYPPYLARKSWTTSNACQYCQQKQTLSLSLGLCIMVNGRLGCCIIEVNPFGNVWSRQRPSNVFRIGTALVFTST